MPVVAEMLNISKDLHLRLAIQPDSLESRTGDEKLRKNPMWRPRQVLQLGVNYRWSPIVLECRVGDDDNNSKEQRMAYGIEGDRLRAGDRAPDISVLKPAGGGEERKKIKPRHG